METVHTVTHSVKGPRPAVSTLRTGIVAAGLLATLAIMSPLAAQEQAARRATVTGTVTDAASRAPVPGVTVVIPGTSYQTTTDEEGKYTLRNVPFGTQTITGRRVGYSLAHYPNVRINGANVVHDMSISQIALSLSAVTTSATVDPTSGTQSPFAVAKLTMDNIPVPTTGVAVNLQGKVAGLQVTRSSGSTGGDEPWIQIRSI
jgi:hypothetical protein